VARILIVGSGCRGRRLAVELVGEGNAVRMTTRTEAGRAAIEASGAECWIGTPDRLATLRGALDGVTIACWLLATATGSQEGIRDLHGSRLEFFLSQAIDTTVRGFVYEAGSGGAVPAEVLAGGERIVQRIAERNEIPVGFLRADPGDADAWLADAHAEIGALLEGR
jgi:hypothetical protein